MQPKINESSEKLRQELKQQIKEFEDALTVRRQMIEMLGSDHEKPKSERPRTKAWLLRTYLETTAPNGIPINEVPRALFSVGFVSKERIPTTNWLRQLKPQWQFFEIKKGWVKLRDDVEEIDKKYQHGVESPGPLQLLATNAQ